MSFIHKTAAPSLVLLAVLFSTSQSASAAKVTRPVLKEYFQSGDKPTAEQFGSLIDSMINYTDDRALLGLKTYNPTATYLPGDTVIAQQSVYLSSVSTDPSQYVNPSGLNLDMAHDFAGQHGYLAFKLGDSSGLYFGYMQLTMEPYTPVSPGPGIFVEYIVFESTPFAPLEITEVPEPASLAMLAGSAGVLLRRRRR